MPTIEEQVAVMLLEERKQIRAQERRKLEADAVNVVDLVCNVLADQVEAAAGRLTKHGSVANRLHELAAELRLVAAPVELSAGASTSADRLSIELSFTGDVDPGSLGDVDPGTLSSGSVVAVSRRSGKTTSKEKVPPFTLVSPARHVLTLNFGSPLEPGTYVVSVQGARGVNGLPVPDGEVTVKVEEQVPESGT